MDSKTRVFLGVTTTLMFIFCVSTVYLLFVQEECRTEDSVDDRALVFRTDKEEYKSGQIITFILENNGTEGVTYDTELRETLQIFSPSGEIIVMLPHIQTGGLTTIQPGETLTWTWNQTYYLYIWEEGKVEPTWDWRSWTRVTAEREYTAVIKFNKIEEELKFRITN